MAFRRPERSRTLLGIAAAAAFALVACGTSYQYVGSATLNNVFRVPDGWSGYGKYDLLKAAGINSDAAAAGRFKFLQGYDANPSDPSIIHVLDTQKDTSYPVILAWVQQLGAANRDKFSLGSIRNALYQIDAHINDDTGDLLSYDGSLVLPGGLHGSKATYVITGPAPEANSYPQPVEVSQVGVLNPSTNLFYYLSVRCSPQCFTQYHTTISEILNSWTVKET